MGTSDHVDEILGQWRENAERGKFVQPESLIESHPDEADVLRERFAALALIDQYYAEEDALPFVTPERLGDYRIIREIGRGGMGVVYEAVQESMGRKVALKVLYPTVATTVTTRKRFDREARITGRLHHTNIVTVYGMGQDEGYAYFAMELVEGAPLDQLIAHLRSSSTGTAGSESLEGHATDLRGPKAHAQIAMMVAGVADALEVAHAQGVIHRDVKPSNLILDDEGELKLTDFGLAHFAGDDFGVTRTGEILGTPLYMSPEQVRARREDLDHRTDVYSLGATLYELLSLERVHESDNVGTLCSKILTEEPAALRSLDPSIPKDLATIVHKAIRKQRGDRYASAGAMAADLRALAAGRSIKARPLGPLQKSWRAVKRHPIRASLLTVAILLGCLGGWLKSSADRAHDAQADAEYEVLLLRGHTSAGSISTPFSIRYGAHNTQRRAISPAEQAFSGAIRLRPSRPDAWLGRAMLPDRPTADRLRDLDQALENGLADRTVHLARAYVLLNARQPAEAHQEHELAGPSSSGVDIETLLEGWILFRQGAQDEGLALLDRLVGVRSEAQYVHVLALLHRGQAKAQLGRWAEAVQDLSAFVAMGGGDPAAAVQLANAWLCHGDRQQADDIIERTIDETRQSQDARGWVTLWFMAFSLGHDTWIDRIATAAFAHMPESPIVRMIRARQLAASDRREEALALLDDSSRALATQDPVDVRVLLLRAIVFDQCRRYEESVAAFRAVLTQEPDNPAAHTNLGQSLLSLGRNEEGLALLRRAVDLAPSSFRAHESLSHALQVLGNPEEALAVAKRAVALAPHQLDGLLALSEAYRSVQDYTASLATATHALEMAPTSAKAAKHLGAGLNNVGRFQDALRATASISPAGEVAFVRGYAFEHLGQLEDAHAAYKQATAWGKNLAPCLVAQARVLRKLGRAQEAAASLDAALEVKVVTPDQLTYRADELRAQGRPHEALRDSAEAARRAPMVVRAVDGHVLMLYDLGRWKAALAVLDAAAKRGVPTKKFRRRRARILRQLGRFQESLDVWNELIVDDPRPSNVMIRGVVFMQLGRRKEGLRDLRAGNAERPEDAVGVLYLMQALWTEQAWEEIASIVERMPENARDDRHHRGHGLALYFASHLERAVVEFGKLSPVGRNHPDILRSEVDALRKLNRREEAGVRIATALEYARSQGSDSARACLSLGYTLMKLDEVAHAVAALERALEEPAIREDLPRNHRYNAACMAARAGAESAIREERDAYRAKALKWLQADVKQRRALFGSSVEPAGHGAAKAAFDKYVAHALQDTDLESLRDAPEFVALFPPAASAVSGKPK